MFSENKILDSENRTEFTKQENRRIRLEVEEVVYKVFKERRGFGAISGSNDSLILYAA